MTNLEITFLKQISQKQILWWIKKEFKKYLFQWAQFILRTSRLFQKIVNLYWWKLYLYLLRTNSKLCVGWKSFYYRRLQYICWRLRRSADSFTFISGINCWFPTEKTVFSVFSSFISHLLQFCKITFLLYVIDKSDIMFLVYFLGVYYG